MAFSFRLAPYIFDMETANLQTTCEMVAVASVTRDATSVLITSSDVSSQGVRIYSAQTNILCESFSDIRGGLLQQGSCEKISNADMEVHGLTFIVENLVSGPSSLVADGLVGFGSVVEMGLTSDLVGSPVMIYGPSTVLSSLVSLDGIGNAIWQASSHMRSQSQTYVASRRTRNSSTYLSSRSSMTSAGRTVSKTRLIITQPTIITHPGQSFSVNAIVRSLDLKIFLNPGGVVEFYVNGRLATYSNVDMTGNAVGVISNVPVGVYGIEAVYLGTPNFITSRSSRLEHVVKGPYRTSRRSYSGGCDSGILINGSMGCIGGNK
jgi:hypothetical protein